MRLKSIELTNFKGTTAKHRLEKMNLIVGLNSAGKTTIASAIRLALAGSLPVIGRAGQSVYKLAGDPDAPGEMAVSAICDDGGLMMRRYRRSDAGAVSIEASVVGDREWPAAMLDFRSFLSLTGRERAVALFAACRSSAQPADWIEQASVLPVPPLSPDRTRPAIAVILAELPPKKDTHEFCESATKTLATILKVAKADAQALSAALKGVLSQEPKGTTRTNEAELQRIKQQLKDADVEFRRLSDVAVKASQQLSNANAANLSAKSRAAEAQQAIAVLRQKIAKAATMAKCPTCGQDCTEYRSRVIKSFETDIAKHEEIIKREVASITSTGALEDAYRSRREEVDTARKRVDELTVAAAQAGATQDARQRWRQACDSAEEAASAKSITVAVCSALVKSLDTWRMEQVDAGVKRLLKVANQFTMGLLLSPLEWNDERAEFGRRATAEDGAKETKAVRAGAWISLDAFGGFEEQLAFAALSVAVSSDAEVKLVIMDELGRLDPMTKLVVWERMKQLIEAKVIDQFIGVDVTGTNLFETADADSWSNVILC